MQYYKKNKDKYGVFTDFFDDSMNGKEELFSKEGCKMTAAAKVSFSGNRNRCRFV